MTLTPEQQRVVFLAEGRHLVLAPPGSGKTEMLSQRVLHAIRAGVSPARMLCATFTNRAAFEMRERVARGGEGLELPDVGNLHHFCHRFLVSVGRLMPTKHILDEVEQLEFVHEVVDVLRQELEVGESTDLRRTHGVSVLRHIRGMVSAESGEISVRRQVYVHELLENHFAECHKAGRSPYAPFLPAVQIAHQRRIGIARDCLRRMDEDMRMFDHEGVVSAVARGYATLKRKFNAADFDDLLNETYLFLEAHPLDDGQRFDWIQIDEVQDLNPIQWRIVRGLTSSRAVSVYFGDVEQAIFSFLGASARHFEEAVRDCERHYFKTNFRATPLLLEVLMRYSIGTLKSDWEFLPAPSDAQRANGELTWMDGGKAEAMARVRGLLDSEVAENVALLVRRNQEADEFEELVRAAGYRYAKVSGVDLFSTALMRDFMAFVSLFADHPSRVSWSVLVYRFSEGIARRADARYFVREMFAAGHDPEKMLESNRPFTALFGLRGAGKIWAWRWRRRLSTLHAALHGPYSWVMKRKGGRLTFDEVFEQFVKVALKSPKGYSLYELWPERYGPTDAPTPGLLAEAKIHATERVGKFLRYAKHARRGDSRSFSRMLSEDWDRLTTLKESDLLVGDEKVVISTVHKAKGRQFDAVVIPDAVGILHGNGGSREEQARLLYVAMSRAKRHLAIFAGAKMTELDDIRQCFEAGYVGYYQRKEKREDVSGDWLYDWETLAAYNRAGVCPIEKIERYLQAERTPIVRMAFKVLRHYGDASGRRRMYLTSLDVCQAADSAIDCMRQCHIVDSEVIERVRNRTLAKPAERDVRTAAFRYLESAMRLSLVGSSATDKQRRALQTDAIGDFLYSIDGGMRVAAAALLAESGDNRWIGNINGGWADFDWLRIAMDTRHDDSIRTLMHNTKVDRYREKLGELLLSHAQSSA